MKLILDESDLDLLEHSSLFAGIPRSEYEAILEKLHASIRKYRVNGVMRRAGDSLDFYPFILSGSIRATLLQGGEPREVARFTKGDSFAEAVPGALKHCPVDIWVIEDAAILCIPAETLAQSNELWALKMRDNLAKEMSKKVMRLSENLRILGEPRLSDKILAYVRALPADADGYATVPLSRIEWASYLRVSDKSLIRELRTMKTQGVLDVDGRRIRILTEDRPTCNGFPSDCKTCLGGAR